MWSGSEKLNAGSYTPNKKECILMQSSTLFGMHPHLVHFNSSSSPLCSPYQFMECTLIQSLTNFGVQSHVVLITIKNAASSSPPPRYHMVHIIILWSISFGQYYMHFITLYYSYDTNNIINTQCNFEVMPFSIEITSIWIILARLLSYSINQS